MSTANTAAGDCTDCPDGYYCPPGSHRPLLCPTGMACDNKDFDVRACPEGTQTTKKGQTEAECIGCPEGHYCPLSHEEQDPIECPIGTYQDATGGVLSEDDSSGKLFCKPCEAGYACATLGLVNQVACDPGYFSPA